MPFRTTSTLVGYCAKVSANIANTRAIIGLRTLRGSLLPTPIIGLRFSTQQRALLRSCDRYTDITPEYIRAGQLVEAQVRFETRCVGKNQPSFAGRICSIAILDRRIQMVSRFHPHMQQTLMKTPGIIAGIGCKAASTPIPLHTAYKTEGWI